MELHKQIVNWIRTQVKKSDKKGLVFGLSGGIDSAVVCALSKLAVGENALGLILPCKSAPRDVELALKVAKKFGVKTKKVVLDRIFDALVKIYPKAGHLAKSNLKPRLRMAVLYYFANILDYLVVGTGNKSELAVGYFTKHGDGGVDILPLGGLLKTEVRVLARSLSIPHEIIDRPPSAGLWPGQTDEGEMDITYDELDKIITAVENEQTKGVDKRNLLKVNKMMAYSEHKRCKTPVFNKN
ncbi:MAG: NAD(+) synthase [Omnitrophica bacterium RBG_13_46_9]|nr:MAG: NAD(+) synthase [Omnitrophica bacterium RBG_13_46_9]